MCSKTEGYGRTVVLKRGEDRHEQKLNEISIPDLWHVAMAFPEGSRERESILKTWHLAHDFKRNLAGDI